jgi:dipeptidase
VKNGIDESVLPTIVIPYVSTALEGVEFLGNLVAQYGSAEGNTLVFADARETWYMEIYTGHQWAAIRFPEDRYAVIANDSLLGNLDVNDTANVKTSPNLVKLAREHHFLRENNGQIHVAHTYGAPHRDYSQLRVWAAQRKLSPSQSRDYDVRTTYGLLQKPDRKISLAEAMDLFRYRYEDTAYNTNTHPDNRAIGINRTAEGHFFWLRDNKPQTLWVALANPEMSIFLPLYGNVTQLPEAFTLDAATYNKDSAYWKFRSLSALAVQDRTGYGQEVRSTWKKMELDLIKNMPALDAQYRAAGSTSQAANKLCGDVANKALHTADALFQKTWTAFMLSTVQDGKSKHTAGSNDAH